MREENGGVLFCEKMSKEWVRRMEGSQAKGDNVNVTVRVIIVVEDVLLSVK